MLSIKDSKYVLHVCMYHEYDGFHEPFIYTFDKHQFHELFKHDKGVSYTLMQPE